MFLKSRSKAKREAKVITKYPVGTRVPRDKKVDRMVQEILSETSANWKDRRIM